MPIFERGVVWAGPQFRKLVEFLLDFFHAYLELLHAVFFYWKGVGI